MLNLDESSATVNELLEKMQKLYHVFAEKPPTIPDGALHWRNFSEAYQALMQGLIANPHKLAGVQKNYWEEYAALVEKNTLHWLGTNSNSSGSDKRFKDPLWHESPLFNFFKDYYLLSSKHIQSLINSVDSIDEKTTRKINFYTQLLLDALSPNNFIATNPTVLQKTVKSHGKNLIKGVDNLIEDLKRTPGRFQIKMTDLNAFKIGENIAITPGKVIYQNDLIQLIQYSPQTVQIYKKPLLIIPPWINKYFILDLSPENSFVKWVVEQGYTVFIISWINPDHRHANKNFEDYMSEGALAAIEAITEATGEKKINALGYCLGGTLLAATLAYMVRRNDKRVVSATYLTTLLDFSEPGDLGVFIDEPQIQQMEKQMEELGYLDGSVMTSAFNMLRSSDLVWNYYVKNYLEGEDPLPLDLLYWNSDATRLPARAHSFYLRNMYLNNVFHKPDGIHLKGVPIDISKIKIPVYFLSAEQDHIAPWQSTYAGIGLHGGPVNFVLSGSGHIAGVINPPQKNKYYYYTHAHKPKNPDSFLNKARKREGSWWPHWEKWQREYSGKKIKARHPGEGNLPILQDAPGSYVKVRFDEKDK